MKKSKEEIKNKEQKLWKKIW